MRRAFLLGGMWVLLFNAAQLPHQWQRARQSVMKVLGALELRKQDTMGRRLSPISFLESDPLARAVVVTPAVTAPSI
jgi:hypothetical protein